MAEEKTNLLHEARNSVNRERYVDALHMINEVIKEHPEEWEAYILAIRCYLQNFQAKERCLQYQQLIEKLCDKIVVYVDENHLAQAQAYVKRAKEYLQKYQLQEEIKKCEKDIQVVQQEVERATVDEKSNIKCVICFGLAGITIILGLCALLMNPSVLVIILCCCLLAAGIGAFVMGLRVVQERRTQDEEKQLLERLKQKKASLQIQLEKMSAPVMEEQ